MRLLVILLLFPLCLFAQQKPFVLKDYEREPKTLGQVSGIVVRYNRQRLTDSLHQFLMAARPSRFIGSSGHEKARQQLISALQDRGTVAIENFKLDISGLKKQFHADLKSTHPQVRTYAQSMTKILQQVGDFEGQNIVWEKKGSLNPQEVLIIGAHYDTIAIDPKTMEVTSDGEMPGADHNGSGVVAALALIEVLSQVNLPRTVRVVFFDAESLGRSGSNAYVSKHRDELSQLKLAGFVNLLMLGHDSVANDKQKKKGNMCFYIRPKSEDDKGAKLDHALANQFIEAGKEVRSSVTFEVREHADLMSSHLAFQKLEIPALVMTHDWEHDFNQSLHTTQDFAETLNFATFHASTQYLMGSVLAWAFDIR